MATSTGWLANLLGPVAIKDEGEAVTPRGALNFVGATITSNAVTNAIDIAIEGGSVADDIAKSAGTTIDRVQGIRGVPIEAGALEVGGTYVYDDGTFTGGVPRLKRRDAEALDPRDFGCPWDGVGDDLPGLEALIASIPSSQTRPVRIRLPRGLGYCSDNLRINRPVEIIGQGKAYAAATSLQHGIRFAPLKGLILDGYYTSTDFPGGRADNSRLRGISIVSTQAVASDAVGNWGRAMYQLDTSVDVWSQLPATVALGSCVLRSGATVGSSPIEYYGDGTTRDTTHVVMFRCTTSGTKGSAEPGSFATAGLAQLGTTISATGGTAVWTVESIPKDYIGERSYLAGERVFLAGDPDHVFEAETSGTSKGWSTTIAAGSNGAVLPQATINVASAATFPTAGTARVITSTGAQIVTYTGKSGTTLTGCTGGTGTMSTGGAVTAPYSYPAFGVAGRVPDAMVAPAFDISFYDRGTAITGASAGAVLPQATIEVLDTTDFAASGTIQIWTGAAFVEVAYTGKTATTFTGCAGGTGTMADAAEVGQGIRWKHVPGAEGVTVLANWVDLEEVHIAGATGAAIWITGNYRRTSTGAGGSNFWSLRDAIYHSCGGGLTLNSNNANGGESNHCQQFFIGAGHTNVDEPAYLNAGRDRWGNGGAAVKDRCQGNNVHADHYMQTSGGMPFRNDLFTGVNPGGNSTSWTKLAVEGDFLAELQSPALVVGSPYGTSPGTTAMVLDGSLSKSIRTSAALVSDPTKSVVAVFGPQHSSAASPWTMTHSDDGVDAGFTPSDETTVYPAKWWIFGRANSPGAFDQQVFLVPRPGAGATWPGGTSLGVEMPMWINNDRVWLGGAPNQDPRSIGFGTAAPVAGYYVRGSVVWNQDAAVGQPNGWRCTVTGSPGTWVAMANL